VRRLQSVGQKLDLNNKSQDAAIFASGGAEQAVLPLLRLILRPTRPYGFSALTPDNYPENSGEKPP